LAFSFFLSNLEEHRNLEFNKAIQSISTRVENLKQTEISILTSMRGLYNVLPQVTKDYFEIYGTVPLETYKSIATISYIVPLKNSDKNSFLFDQYSVGYYYYEIRPPGERNEYHVIQMMAPFPNYNEHLLGYDIKSQPEIFSAYNLAKEKGNMVCSEFINFSIHSNNLTTFFLSPVYRQGKELSTVDSRVENFQGVLALEININEFFEEALRGGSSLNKSTFSSDSSLFFDVFEVRSDGSKVKCFSSSNRDPKYDVTKAELNAVVDLYLANKKVEFHFYSNSFMEGKQQAYLPWAILILSLIMSFILFGFVYTVIVNHAKLELFAFKVSQSQKSILDHTQELIVTLDYKSHFKVINNVFQNYFGVSENESNVKFTDLITDENECNNFEELLKTSMNEQTKAIDISMKHQNGQIIRVEWTIIFFKDDHQINLIGRII
jgi:PAS domain-containing protein